MKLTEKTLSREYRYRGKIINLRVDRAQLENGRVVSREVVEHPGGVCIGALTEQGELLFVRQFRYPYG
ncbi:MAG TPA: ADP-ribose pyrophosphatase, partial [Ruminococcaceae bacterium]|nr:ADP-ribose pyrophosphatase [Oscillospiraceae bacterium]